MLWVLWVDGAVRRRSEVIYRGHLCELDGLRH